MISFPMPREIGKRGRDEGGGGETGGLCVERRQINWGQCELCKAATKAVNSMYYRDVAASDWFLLCVTF